MAHWSSSYPDYLSLSWDTETKQRVVWSRLQEHQNLASRKPSRQTEWYHALHQEFQKTQVGSSHEPLSCDSTLEMLMKDAQGWVMEVMKELVTIEGQLSLHKKRLEISDAYEELDCHFCLANPVPMCPRHSPLVEAPRVVRAIVLLPSCTRGAVEMPILHSNDPDHRWVVRCFRC